MSKILAISILSLLALSACTNPISLNQAVNEEPQSSSLETETSENTRSIIPDGTWIVDSSASQLKWQSRYILKSITHNGTVEVKSGKIEIENGAPAEGEFTLDMTTIKNLDLSEERRAQLEGHLKSADFFDVENHSEAFLKVTEIRDLRGSEVAKGMTVKADLTIKGITNSVSFPADIRYNNDQIFAEAMINIDRSRWNVRFGSGKFFSNLGDSIIDDIIKYTVILTLTK